MKVVVIAGGQWQLPIVKFLKDKGDSVIVVNPEKTETTDLADYHIKQDIRNIPKIIPILQELNPDAITSDQSDIATMSVSLLSKALNKIGNSIESTLLFTNKLFMYYFAVDNNICVPNSAKIETPQDIVKFAKQFTGPYVLKPTDSNASRGFIYLDTLDDLQQKLGYVLSTSKLNFAIIQQYIKGTGIILDGICSGGKHKTLTCAKKSYFREGVISKVEYPYEVPDKVIEANDRFVERSGLSFGITHAEYIIQDNNYYLVEIAARGGGFRISSDIIPWVSGVNVYEILYKDLCGTKTDLNFTPEKNKAAICFYEYPYGIVKSITGVEEAKKITTDFKMMIEVGEKIVPAKDGGTRHAAAVILGDYEKIDKKIQEMVKVEC